MDIRKHVDNDQFSNPRLETFPTFLLRTGKFKNRILVDICILTQHGQEKLFYIITTAP
jgi:hypothetical protein